MNASTLSFASMAMLGILLVIAVVFVVVLVRAIRVASGRGSARRESGGETAMLSMALQDAMIKLKQQERAMAARAEASERLADQIVGGLTSGLVVVDRGGMKFALPFGTFLAIGTLIAMFAGDPLIAWYAGFLP